MVVYIGESGIKILYYYNTKRQDKPLRFIKILNFLSVCIRENP